jgi:RHS repeat-associated protein
MEKDDEVKGSGNSYTTVWRQYDPRVGRFFSVDPKSSHPLLIGQSPYNFSMNSPISLKDPNGDCPICITAGVGALIGGTAGFVGGLIAGKSFKESVALGIGGAVAGAIVGSGVGLIAGAGGVATLGAANAVYLTGAAGISGAIGGNLSEQGAKNVLGIQDGFDKEDFSLSLSLSIPSILLDKATGNATQGFKAALKKKTAAALAEEITFQQKKEFINTTKKQLKEALGNRITSKEARQTAEKALNFAIKSEAETVQIMAEATEKGVDITIGAILVGPLENVEDKAKEEIKK